MSNPRFAFLRTPIAWASILLGLAAIGLTLASPTPLNIGLPLGMAALLGAGGGLGPFVGLLALAAAFTSGTPTAMTPQNIAAVLMSGLALSALIRATQPAMTRLIAVSPITLAVFGTLAIVGFSGFAPDSVRLVTEQGAPAVFSAVLQDAQTGLRWAADLPAQVRDQAPLSALHPVFPWAFIASLVLLLFAQAAQNPRARLVGWTLLGLAGALFAATGLTDALQLFGGTISLPDPEALRVDLALRAGGHIAIESVQTLESPLLGLGSRPLVDPLRIALGVAFVLLARTALRMEKSDGIAPPAQAGTNLWLPIAGLFLIATAALTMAPSLALAALASVALLIASGVSGALDPADGLMSARLRLVALTFTLIGLIGPILRWLPAWA